ncbi:MAG TPA: two-component regulator propeller domain-containing protein, partial [Verrucomicrobiae bacterium]|nr:two-component regulator propeller domain-containing protein [Verrucomicrobiae bacterium]
MAISRAEAEEPISHEFTIRRWTTDDGLPQNRISSLAQTPEGYLWLGTWFGVVRFDGLHFTVFNQYNTPALANDAVNALAATPDGSLWIGTHGGLVRYHDGEWTRFTAEMGLREQSIWELLVDPAGKLWIRGEDVGEFPAGPFVRVREDVPSHALMVLPNGDAVVVTSQGPAPLSGVKTWEELLKGGRNKAFDLESGIGRPSYPTDSWPCRTIAGEGEDWFLWASSTWIWEVGNDVEQRSGWARCVWERITPEVFPEFLYRQKNGAIWGWFHKGGLRRFSRFNGAAFEFVRLLEGEQQPAVNALLDDREGNLWAATDGG